LVNFFAGWFSGEIWLLPNEGGDYLAARQRRRRFDTHLDFAVLMRCVTVEEGDDRFLFIMPLELMPLELMPLELML
jgi:hypothetical protein